jgi:hypothetical protein
MCVSENLDLKMAGMASKFHDKYGRSRNLKMRRKGGGREHGRRRENGRMKEAVTCA